MSKSILCFLLPPFLFEPSFLFKKFSFWISNVNYLNEMSKSNSSCSLLSCLDQLRFIECCNRIVVHCLKFIYLFEFPCSESHISLFGYWENVGQEKFFLFHRSTKRNRLIGIVGACFFTILLLSILFHQFSEQNSVNVTLFSLPCCWFQLFFFFFQHVGVDLLAHKVVNATKGSLAVAVWTCHCFSSWANHIREGPILPLLNFFCFVMQMN